MTFGEGQTEINYCLFADEWETGENETISVHIVRFPDIKNFFMKKHSFTHIMSLVSFFTPLNLWENPDSGRLLPKDIVGS